MNLNHYIGIPYKERGRDFTGADCWGICRMVAKDLLYLSLPEYFYDETQILEDAEKLIRENSPRWVKVETDYYKPGDIHIFRIKGHETHCGIHIAGKEFLHSLPGRNSCMESLVDIQWVHRKTGSFRWNPA